MAPPYSNGFSSALHKPGRDGISVARTARALVARVAHLLQLFVKGKGRRMALAFTMGSITQIRRNLTSRRLLSFPHAVVMVWIFVLLWGERWIFHSKVEKCHWRNWESWPAGANPHHLVFVADPQLIDPHSYPGRPWPLNPLTVLVTDNYLRRSYTQLQKQLHPDTIFFLGDLFDGGREWKTTHGEFKDPAWSHRPSREQKHAKQWKKKYGDNYWLREYARFGDIFFRDWSAGGANAGPGQRGRRLIASLPGNHDLGFGSEVKLGVRNRFECYFGEGNRVDVIGNHTFVSVDTVSLSAGSSEHSRETESMAIYSPVDMFLKQVPWLKRKAIAKELRYQQGEVPEVRYAHKIEGLDRLDKAELDGIFERSGGEKGQADLPTVLLTHVPLYRPPGTPCGPMREHWPPTKPAKGETGPVIPDDRNAISVSGGYQYQNVLTEQDSVRLVKSIGNVMHAFSGDDHDYCELTHDRSQQNVHEITVKSISMAMGVPTPGFLMVSMYNPIDATGHPLPGSPPQTMQTHLCLLPTQLSTYSRYGLLVLATVVALAVRAFLVPILKLQPFALDPHNAAAAAASGPPSSLLPMFKAKMDDDYDAPARPGSGGGGGGGASGFAARSSSSFQSRDRGGGSGGTASSAPFPARPNGAAGAAGVLAQEPLHKHKSRHSKGSEKWGWGAGVDRGPKIQIRNDDDFYDGDKWKAAQRRSAGASSTVGVVGRELWTTLWRVAWMAVLFWGWLAYKG